MTRQVETGCEHRLFACITQNWRGKPCDGPVDRQHHHSSLRPCTSSEDASKCRGRPPPAAFTHMNIHHRATTAHGEASGRGRPGMALVTTIPALEGADWLGPVRSPRKFLRLADCRAVVRLNVTGVYVVRGRELDGCSCVSEFCIVHRRSVHVGTVRVDHHPFSRHKFSEHFFGQMDRCICKGCVAGRSARSRRRSNALALLVRNYSDCTYGLNISTVSVRPRASISSRSISAVSSGRLKRRRIPSIAATALP